MNLRTAANKRRILKLALGFGVVVTAVSTLIFGGFGHLLFGFFFGLLVAALWLIIAWLRGDRLVLQLCEAKPINEHEQARLVNVTSGLCAVMGLNAPRLYWVDDRSLNALAVGRDDRHSSIVVTRGLLEEASLVELEAAIALQLLKIKSHETAVGTLAIGTVGTSWVLSEYFDRTEPLRRLFALPIGLIQRVLAHLHPGNDDIVTDIAAVQVTRYPPAMATLLEKMAGRSALASAAPVTSLMWMAPPVPPAAGTPALQALHLPLQQRAAVLQEL